MKGSKNIYELLNQVDVNFDEYKMEEVNDMEKQRLKNNFRKNRKILKFKQFGIITASLLLAISVLSQTNFGSYVYAAAESKLTEISYSIGKALGIEKDIEPYANVINQIVENKGIEAKLSEVIIDKDELIFSAIVNTNKEVERCSIDYEIFINGKKLRNYGATGTSKKIDDSNSMFSYTYCVDVEGIDIDEDVDIKIRLSEINYYIEDVYEDVKGKWDFEFTANGKELMESTYGVQIDYSFNIDEQLYTLEEYRFNPVNQKIYGKVKGESDSSYNVQLRGYDNLGNEVFFFLSSKTNEDVIFRYQNYYGDLSDEILSITLTPYAAKIPEENGIESEDWEQVGEEFIILIEKEK